MSGVVLIGSDSSSYDYEYVYSIAQDGTATVVMGAGYNWRRLQYSTDRSELIGYTYTGSTLQLWRADPDGSGLDMIASLNPAGSSFSDNIFYGTSSDFKIVFIGSSEVRLSTDGSTSSLLIDSGDFPGASWTFGFSPTWPVWSPDGTKFAIVTTGWTTAPGDRIYFCNDDGSGLAACAVTGLISTDDPVWAPDSSGVYYIGGATISDITTYRRIWFANTASTSLVYNHGSDITQRLQLSPDGTMLAYHSGGDIHIVNVDGSGYTNLTSSTLPYTHNETSWRLDGNQIAVCAGVGGNSNPDPDSVVLIDVPSGTQTILYPGTTFHEYWSFMQDYEFALERPDPAAQPGLYAVYHNGAWHMHPGNALP